MIWEHRSELDCIGFPYGSVFQCFDLDITHTILQFYALSDKDLVMMFTKASFNSLGLFFCFMDLG